MRTVMLRAICSPLPFWRFFTFWAACCRWYSALRLSGAFRWRITTCSFISPRGATINSGFYGTGKSLRRQGCAFCWRLFCLCCRFLFRRWRLTSASTSSAGCFPFTDRQRFRQFWRACPGCWRKEFLYFSCLSPFLSFRRLLSFQR